MKGLYKVDKIHGKGFGWIALQDIKAGTLIDKEKPQFVPKEPFELGNMMEAFNAMSKDDQQEFLKLSNAFLDLDSLPELRQKRYFDCKNFVEKHHGFDSDLLLKIIHIYITNAFGVVKDGVDTDDDNEEESDTENENGAEEEEKEEDGQDYFVFAPAELYINASKMNHSCIPNAERIENEDELEIRATSNISEGQEITTTYIDPMKNFNERREICHKYGFVCSCDLCQYEEINNDDKIYQKFQELKDEAEKTFSNVCDDVLSKHFSFEKKFHQIKKALLCRNQMYNLARNKKATKFFILKFLGKSFYYASFGYDLAMTSGSYKTEFAGKMEKECRKLSKEGLQIAEMIFGQKDSVTKEWKEKNQDFKNWYRKNFEK